jgi:hypothetical protein
MDGMVGRIGNCTGAAAWLAIEIHDGHQNGLFKPFY